MLDLELARLERINEDVREAEARLKEVTAEDETTQKLLEHDNIGLVTVVTMRAEIGDFDRFRNGK